VTTDDTADRGQGTDEAGSFEGGVADLEEDRPNQGNFYTYCLIKNICILAGFLPTYLHTLIGSLTVHLCTHQD